MARRSFVEFHNFWGQFAAYANLPNVALSTTQNTNLQTGDIDTSGGTNHVLTTNLISSASTLTLSASDENAHNIIY